MFPIKYIDNNLVWNKDNEVFAYYELIPYNYSFLSAEEKFIVHDSFRQLIAQSREGKIHALQIATESSIRSMQEQSKKLVTGKLREVALEKIDEQTEALVSMIGDNQVDYRFFLGFKLMVTEEQLNLKNIKKSAWLTFTEFLILFILFFLFLHYFRNFFFLAVYIYIHLIYIIFFLSLIHI